MTTNGRAPLDRYTCEEVLRRLDDFIDRELSSEEMRLIREHLEICAACATELGFEEAVIEDVRAKLHRIKAPSELISKVSLLLAGGRTPDAAS